MVNRKKFINELGQIINSSIVLEDDENTVINTDTIDEYITPSIMKQIESEENPIFQIDELSSDSEKVLFCLMDNFFHALTKIDNKLDDISVGKTSNKKVKVLIFIISSLFVDNLRASELLLKKKGLTIVKHCIFLPTISDDNFVFNLNGTIANNISLDVSTNSISSELYAVKLFDLIDLYNKYGDLLFAKNVRYHINSKKMSYVDRGIIDTIQNEPEMFWFYHNGITILVNDDALNKKNIETVSIDVSKTSSISVINGAQTIHTVATAFYGASNKLDDYSQQLIKRFGKNYKKEIAEKKLDQVDIDNFVQSLRDKIISGIGRSYVLLRIIINKSKNSKIDEKLSLNLNSQKPVGIDDMHYFEPVVQKINELYSDRFEIIRNGDKEDITSMNLSNFIKFYAICILHKPGTARSNKTTLLDDDKIWNSLKKSLDELENKAFNAKDELQTSKIYDEWFENNIEKIKSAYSEYKDFKKKSLKEDNKFKEIYKYGKEFCLAYYYMDDANKPEDFNSKINAILEKIYSLNLIKTSNETKTDVQYDNFVKVMKN